jgi:TolB protein
VPFRDEDIYQATRPSLDAAFANPIRVEALASTAFDGAVFLTSDELELYFSSERAGGAGKRDLWVSRRAQASAAFGAPTPVTALNSADNEQNPSLTADGLLLFFASDRDGNLDDIWVAFRVNRGGAFSRPMKAPGLNSAAKDTAPFVTPDGLAVYFTSDRAGGKGGLDIYTATRANRLVAFETPTVLATISSNVHDEDPALSLDGRELYFASGRNGKGFSLYRASRCP